MQLTDLGTCQFTMTDPGPHPGCSEFDDDPGVIECDNTFTVAVVFDTRTCMPGDEVLFVCAAHAAEVADDPDVVKLVDLMTGEVHCNN